MTDPTLSCRAVAPAELAVRIDLARATSGPFAAVRIDVAGGPAVWIVASRAEVDRGRVPNDDRPRYASIHAAFRAADLRAARTRRQGAGMEQRTGDRRRAA